MRGCLQADGRCLRLNPLAMAEEEVRSVITCLLCARACASPRVPRFSKWAPHDSDHIRFAHHTPQEYEDDFEEENEEEDDYGDDDFEEDDSPATPKQHASTAGGFESDIAKAVRLENERAVRLKQKAAHASTSETAVPSGLSALPTRKVKGLPSSKGSKNKPLTDSQRRAHKSRVSRWNLIAAAVGMTHADAACSFSVFASAPMTPSQMHDAGVGPYSGTRFATTQTGGDWDTREFETQTGGGGTRDAKAQAPDDLGARRETLEAESVSSSQKSSAAQRRETAAQKAMQWARASGDLYSAQEKRLQGFVARVGAVADALLRERVATGGSGSGETVFVDLMRARATNALKQHAVEGQPDNLTSAYVALDGYELTNGRVVAACAFQAPSGMGSKTLCVAYEAKSGSGNGSKTENGAAGRGLVLVWDLASADQKVKHALTLEGSPTCVAWGGGGARGDPHVLLVGTKEGALCLWDLREPDQAGGFRESFIRDENVIDGSNDESSSSSDSDSKLMGLLKKHGVLGFRRPSYSTEGVGFLGRGSSLSLDDLGGAVVSVKVCDEKVNGGVNDWGDFHVLALSSDGNVDAHLVSELPRREAEDAALQDAGLRFGSRVRITRVSSGIKYGDAKAMGTGDRTARTSANCLAVVKQRGGGSCEFFVADESGSIQRGARYGTSNLPRSFAMCDALAPGSWGHRKPLPLAATSLDFNPHALFAPNEKDETNFNLFLAASRGGTVSLYKSSHSLALRVWDSVTSGDVVCVRWSTARPSMFFVLDSNALVFAFDLLSATPETPVHFEAFGTAEKIVAFEVATTGEQGWGKPGQHVMCLGYDDGRVDVHALSKNFVSVTPEEVQALREMLF